MDNSLTKCPVCHGAGDNCSFCGEAGFVFLENGTYYAVDLDANNKPVRGAKLTPPVTTFNSTAGILAEKMLPGGEPHDLIWFLKVKQKK